MKRKIIISSLVLLCAVALYGGTLWVDRDIYVTDRNIKAGDIVIIRVRDFSKLKFDISVVNNSNSNITANPDFTITGFLPKVNSNKTIKNNDSTNFTGNSKIEFSVATTVGQIQANGNVVLTGTRTYTFNGITNTLTVTGIVDPKMISGGVIDSSHVADFRIQITGTKEGLTIRKGQIPQDGTASAELTEQEKQQIIIDYLEKIIRELTR
ncbi:MAG TPA: flagellar basal body L-ring protein FlgH [Spirochaetota bacterium]|jgi:flagellar L-ring protein precursor FlgH|nr:flagellar basal body L-ring protein FlgH [Spirochaetota bacterium]OQA95394.1 MAG: flagellar basal body L-ring protein [Spirochaetes bacterium ADurb.Bin218]HOK00856.1 flagellar basal body L-ring protein FlgH [Spirochaetota bacterium]HOK91192.1 flagellar basal body L-ring protein FlgH [Spirochaetota bacterium]HON15799.1 flagellar basal body L-ring protein FlgH [Spirochaetota bacterium]